MTLRIVEYGSQLCIMCNWGVQNNTIKPKQIRTSTSVYLHLEAHMLQTILPMYLICKSQHRLMSCMTMMTCMKLVVVCGYGS
jgi:hypothetical protein